ncbi:hypothetical protein [Modestobacter italicus]|uniref:hypothetical protein n=1 Tax=Modestobacter italicus (strain DSM 44449 / CECT 9708 / BC 501) TaxID=2732864 RepID=UPI001C96E5B3|nr:hypothetical protein [Modestobacter italicus]
MEDGDTWRPLTVVEASELGWRPSPHGLGNVTRAYDEWTLTSRDQRTYLHLTLGWMNERFEAEWRDIMKGPGYEDSPEPIDIFESRVGMSPSDWAWMTLAGVVRDAVAAYEVYVVKACFEVFRTQGRQTRHGLPPQFPVAREACKMLGVDARPSAVNDIFELRNVLTHQRGELRTEGERQQFSDQDGFWSYLAHLDEARVLQCLDVLAASVDALDPIMWAYSWGQLPAPPLSGT